MKLKHFFNVIKKYVDRSGFDKQRARSWQGCVYSKFHLLSNQKTIVSPWRPRMKRKYDHK